MFSSIGSEKGSTPLNKLKYKHMEMIKFIGFMTLTICIQTILLVPRAVVLILYILEKVITILKKTTEQLIDTTIDELLKNKTLKNGRK